MALFTDGQINNLQDLERYEGGLLDVTSVEQIDVTAKMALAQDLISADLLLFLLKQSPRDPRNVLFSYQTTSARRTLGVSDVVVTEPLKRWHALKSIELTYQDLYNNQLNDRYKGKWLQYRERAMGALEQLYQIGIGLVSDPVAKAGAPLLIGVAGAGLTANYCVQMAWLNRAGQEGGPSDQVSLQVVDGTQLLVAAPPARANAIGWNVYVGFTPDGVSLQNAAQMAPQSEWLLPATGLKLGRAIGTGQTPDRYIVNDRILLRG